MGYLDTGSVMTLFTKKKKVYTTFLTKYVDRRDLEDLLRRKGLIPGQFSIRV